MPWRSETTGQDDVVSWRDSDLTVQQKSRGVIAIRILAVATAVTGFVVLLMDIQRDPVRCHQNCFDGSDNTFEAGHVWTGYAGSWQWDAQLVIGWLAFLTSMWALWAAGRRSRRETVASLGVSIGLIALWIVWLTVQPSPTKLA